MARKSTRKPAAPRADVYTEITERVIAAIERDGIAPWHKPWVGAASGQAPRNALTGKAYNGINVLSLMLSAWEHGWRSNLWVTFSQARELAAKAARAAGRNVELRDTGRKTRKGESIKDWFDVDADQWFRGGVRKGEKASGRIVFFRVVEREKPKEGQDARYSMLRTTAAWNVEQCDGLPADVYPEPGEPPVKPDERSADAEAVIAAWADVVPMAHGGTRAYYVPSEDRIQLPPREAFKSWAAYYSVGFHESAHSTGHASRLNRGSFERCKVWGDHEYAGEELVAEFAACFLTSAVGVARECTLANSAAYLRTWVAKLRDDPKILATAAAAAQRAADLILATAAEAAGEGEAAAA